MGRFKGLKSHPHGGRPHMGICMDRMYMYIEMGCLRTSRRGETLLSALAGGGGAALGGGRGGGGGARALVDGCVYRLTSAS